MIVPESSPEPGSPEESARFKEFQLQLRDHLLSFRRDQTQAYTAVVIPSQSFDPVELAKIEGVAHYEERSLFNLMLLRRPRLEVIYVTSKRLNPLVVDYYLHQMRTVPPSHARARLHLMDCDDASPRPLTQKILERPRLLKRIDDAIPDRSAAHMVSFNATPLERTLSVQLGIPLYGCDPDLIHLGFKSGSREVFQRAGLPVPPGREGLRDVGDLVAAITELWEEVPKARRIVVKLDEGFSGEGNAVLDLEPLADHAPGRSSSSARRRRIEKALPSLRFEAADLGWEAYRDQFNAMGGICEQWIDGDGKTSPSAQFRINPLFEVQAVSTHDQVLGGPSGLVFQGATFPADPGYRMRIQEMGMRVGKELASAGVMGRYGVDFLALPGAGGDDHELYAVEINLRQGGTTHPLNTLKFITDGEYDDATGVFRTAQGQERSYFATDTLSAQEYRGMLPSDLVDLLVVNGVHFRSDETGVLFHLLGCLSEYGKLGCTSVAKDVASALALYDQTIRLIDEATGRR